MPVSFGSFEIARSGLVVNERGLDVTGQNIANVNTAGYVRQQAVIMSNKYQTAYTAAGATQLGLGADIQQIRQIRHTFLDNIYRQESTTLGYWESRQKTFQDVQAIMAEPMESGLQNVLNEFWDSWQELSKEPDSLTVRGLVRQRGEALVQQINHMGTQLDRLQNDLNSEIRVRIDEVNSITSQIAKLNVTILKNEISGDTASDYRDQRNNLIDRLSKLTSINANEMQDGQVDITIGGYFVVQKGNSTDLYAAEKNTGDLFYVPKLAGTNTEVPMKSGILKGLLESRGEVSGAVGSYENGTPNTKADVVFYVDTNSMTAADAALRVNAYRDELQKNGIDCNVTTVNINAANIDDITSAISSQTGLRADANKYAMLVTNSSTGDFTALKNALDSQGMDASVITALPAAAAWTSLAAGTDGAVYDAADPGYTKVMQNAADDTNKDVSDNMSLVPDSLNIVSGMKSRLNALVNILAREVNYLHKSGMTMGNPPIQADDFFTTINSGRPLELGNIRLNPNLSDLNNISASKTVNNGDNSNALAIANLRNTPLIQDSTGILSTDDYYQAIILKMGNNGSEADNVTSSQSKLVTSADDARTSITGVSMDEEMSNMMKYKFAYDAASRALNVIDQMLESVISRLGIGGR